MSEPEYRRIRREKAGKNQEAANRKDKAAAEEARVEQIIGALNSVVERIDRQQNENTPEIQWEHKWRKREVWGLWAAAAVGLGATIVSSVDSHQQREIMKGQLEATQAQAAITISQLAPKMDLILVGPPRPIMGPGNKLGWYVTPKWDNHGSVSATQYWGWDNSTTIAAAGSYLPEIPAIPPGVLDRIPKMTVSPGSSMAQISRFVSQEDVKAAVEGKIRIIIWGSIEYSDDLPGARIHHVRWCNQIIPIDSGETYIFSFPLYRTECNARD